MSNPTRDPAPQDDRWQEIRERQDRGGRIASIAFGVAILAGIGLLAVYVAGGQTQLEGLLLFIAFAAVGLGLGVWVKMIVGPQVLVEDRPMMRSAEASRRAFGETFDQVMGEVAGGTRRRFLTRLLAGAGAILGLGLLFPLRSLGPGPQNELFETAWSRGRRLVDLEGEPIRPEDVIPDQVLTVFPDGSRAADAQTLLIGLRPGLPTTLGSETVENLVAYSKICTHAGCPVGLYRARVGELLCPCHQSTFGVYEGAEVLSGPAGRPLPQLPIGVDDEGYLMALSDYPEPVGPTFWNYTQDPDDTGGEV